MMKRHLLTLAIILLSALSFAQATGDYLFQRKIATGFTSDWVTPTLAGDIPYWSTTTNMTRTPSTAFGRGAFNVADAAAFRTYIGAGVGAGTVTNFSFTDGNGFDGTVTNATTTPALSLITTVTDDQVMFSSSGAIAGDPGFTFNSGTGALTLSGLFSAPSADIGVLDIADELTLSGAAGTAGNVLTSGGAGNPPTWTSPAAGTVTSVSGTSPIASSGGATPAISIANAAADGATKGAASFAVADFEATAGNISIDYANAQAASTTLKGFLTNTDWNTFNGKQSAITFGTGVQTALGVNIGSAGAPVLFNGAGGTPSSITLTNGTSLPIGTGVSGLGTGVATALGVNVGTAGSLLVNGGVLGTPSSGTLTNATGLPISTGVSGLGAGVAAWAATPSSANLRTALTDENGTGVALFDGSTSATFITPALGTPASGVLNNTTTATLATGTSTTALANTAFVQQELNGHPVVYAVFGNTVWTNMPAAATFFNGVAAIAITRPMSLTGFTQVKLRLITGPVAGAAAAKIYVRYRTAFSATLGDYLLMGATEVECAINTTNTDVDSGWIDLVAGAKAEVDVTVIGSGGDGAVDPNIGFGMLMFR